MNYPYSTAGRGCEGPVLPAVWAAHVLLEPGLEVPYLMLGSVHHLHGCIQVTAPQAVVDQSPHWVALHFTVLQAHTHTHTHTHTLSHTHTIIHWLHPFTHTHTLTHTHTIIH